MVRSGLRPGITSMVTMRFTALMSIKSRKIVADTATIAMSNMYSGLSSESEEMGYDALDKPSFFSSQFWKEYIMGDPKEEVFMQRPVWS